MARKSSIKHSYFDILVLVLVLVVIVVACVKFLGVKLSGSDSPTSEPEVPPDVVKPVEGSLCVLDSCSTSGIKHLRPLDDMTPDFVSELKNAMRSDIGTVEYIGNGSFSYQKGKNISHGLANTILGMVEKKMGLPKTELVIENHRYYQGFSLTIWRSNVTVKLNEPVRANNYKMANPNYPIFKDMPIKTFYVTTNNKCIKC